MMNWESEENSIQLVFIVGSGRSGSTLLKNLLDRHPAVAVCPELQFFKYIYSKRKKYSDWKTDYTRKNMVGRMIEVLIDIKKAHGKYRFSKDFLWSKLKDAKNYKDLFFKASEITVSKDRYEIIVHNTPSDIFFLSQLFKMFPDAKVVHIVRDGREVVASARRRGWGNHDFDHAAQWQEALRAYDRAFQKHSNKQGQMYELKYENLVHQPKKELKTLLSFIGLKRAPKSFYEFSDFSYSNSSFDVEKGGLYHSKHFDEFFSPEDQEKIAALLAKDLQHRGYTVDHRVKLYLLLSIWNWLRRIKFRFFMWSKQIGYAHYYYAFRRLIKGGYE